MAREGHGVILSGYNGHVLSLPFQHPLPSFWQLSPERRMEKGSSSSTQSMMTSPLSSEHPLLWPQCLAEYETMSLVTKVEQTNNAALLEFEEMRHSLFSSGCKRMGYTKAEAASSHAATKVGRPA